MSDIKSLFVGIFLLLISGCANQINQSPTIASQQHQTDTFGVVVMAHGGREEWNQGVLNVVAPLKNKYNVEVAFGMADAVSIQEAVAKLEKKGVDTIAVIRMFISGESWYERTEKILGIVEGAPPRPETVKDGHEKHKKHHGHSMELWKINSNARFAMSKQGLSEAFEMNEVLVYRAEQLSVNPENEDLLILAHGPADDEENQRWINNITVRSSTIKDTVPFNLIRVLTLREDWSGKRQDAESKIKEFVQNAKQNNRVAIVIPFRVQGFGPYAKVLEGVAYKANETGLIPHSNVTKWINRQIEEVKLGLYH